MGGEGRAYLAEIVGSERRVKRREWYEMKNIFTEEQEEQEEQEGRGEGAGLEAGEILHFAPIK